MSRQDQFFSGSRRTTSIVTSQNVASPDISTVSLADPTGNYVPVITLSGALTAATLKTMLNITGSGGRMNLLYVRVKDATARTLRVVVTVDGVSVFDRTSASVSAGANRGFLLAGEYATGSSFKVPDITWTTSLKIEIASSLSETDKVDTVWTYNLEA